MRGATPNIPLDTPPANPFSATDAVKPDSIFGTMSPTQPQATPQEAPAPSVSQSAPTLPVTNPPMHSMSQTPVAPPISPGGVPRQATTPTQTPPLTSYPASAPQPPTGQPLTSSAPTPPTSQSPTPATAQPPAPPAPPLTSSGETLSSSEPPRKSNKMKVILGSLVAVFILLAVSTGVLAYVVTYRDVSFGQPNLESTISNLVQSLPLTPKTKHFLFEQNALAHTKVTKQHFVVSVAAQSDDFASSLGMNQLDAQIEGRVDYTDPNNIIGEFSMDVTKEFRMEARKPNHMVYFTFAKIPPMIYSFLGAGVEQQVQPLLENWISYDTTPLETEARELLNDQRSEAIANSESEYEAIANSPLYKKFLSETTVTRSEIDGVPVHVLRTEPSAELIDMAYQKILEEANENDTSSYGTLRYEQDPLKLSEFVKESSIEFWIDSQTYLTRKMRIHFVLDPEASISSVPSALRSSAQADAPVRFVIAASMDGYDEEVIVQTPKDSLTFEEFLGELSELMYGDLGESSMGDTYMMPDESYEYSDDYNSLEYDSRLNFGDLQGFY